ncbi:MAG TPA: polysaccharide deacetylase family protein [Sporichthyaceae bacterium]|nr:polysaccharide deacetylase family protein [Sporichthyaceae bacterium]
MPLSRPALRHGLVRPAIGGVAVAAVVAGAALAAPGLHSHSAGPAHATARLTSASTANPPAAPVDPNSHQGRIDAVWAAARARHPQPPVTVTNPDRPIDCDHLKCIAFTFDDGPNPRTTSRLLPILAAKHVRATFMLVGQMVVADPHAVAEEAKAGDMLGIHTWRHQSLRGRSVQSIADDLTRTSAAITKASGYRPFVVRPPYGAVGGQTEMNVEFPLIKWGVDSEDWRSRNPDAVFKQVTSTAAPGSIVLMHDTYPSTIDAVPRLIDWFAARGYTFVTVSELYGGQLKSHRTYFGREKVVAANRATDHKAGIVRKPWIDPGPAPAVPAPGTPAAPTAEVATPAPSPTEDKYS